MRVRKLVASDQIPVSVADALKSALDRRVDMYRMVVEGNLAIDYDEICDESDEQPAAADVCPADEHDHGKRYLLNTYCLCRQRCNRFTYRRL